MLLAASHLSCAALGGVAATCATWSGSSPATQIGALSVSAVLVALASLLISSKFLRGLQTLLQTAPKGQGAIPVACGIYEIDEVRRQLGEQVQRWSAVTAAAREQARDVEQLVAQIERRGERRDLRPGAAGKQLRQLLGAITRSTDSGLQQMHRR